MMTKTVSVLFVALVLGCVAPVFADDAEVDEKDVLVLTSDNFDEETAKNEFMLIEFYAPWCGHCKKLKPEYAKAATALKEKDVTNTRLAKVDCTAEKDICEKHGVRGYPTLKWFRKGADKPDNFEGQRTADGLVDFVQRFSGPVLTNVEDKDGLEKFVKSSKVVVVGFTDDEAQKKIVEEAAEALRADATFGVGAASLAPSGSPSLLIYLSFADEPVAFEGEYTKSEEIVNFVRKESFPLVEEISPENYKSYIERNLPLVWVFLEKDGRDANIDILKKVAVGTKGQLSWVYLDAQDYGRHAENMGLSDKYPGIVVDDHIQKKKFLYADDGAFEADALSEWAGKVVAGTIDAFVKSEPIPEDNSAPVTVVVGKNYEDIVLDKNKDVLLEFYAPWCGHCKQLAPKYEALGEIFKDDDTVVISKVDGTANDVPLEVQGFPTIFYFPGGNKDEPITYNGERSAAGLAAFVVEHSTTLSEERKKAILEANAPDEDEEEVEEEDDEDEDRDEL